MCCITFQPPKNIISYSFWVFNIAKFFGFIPFSLRFNGKTRETHVSISNVLGIVISSAVYALCIYSMFMEDGSNLPYSQLQVVIVHIASISSGLVAIFVIIIDFINRRRICSLLSFNIATK